MGNLGEYTNSKKILNRYYLINSFRFAQCADEYTRAVTKYWDERNYRMALNIAKQISEKPYTKNILIVGAGHVIVYKRH